MGLGEVTLLTVSLWVPLSSFNLKILSLKIISFVVVFPEVVTSCKVGVVDIADSIILPSAVTDKLYTAVPVPLLPNP